MSYILRIVQQFQPAKAKEFLELEAQFQELELRSTVLPKGRRSLPLQGNGTPGNTLIWECEFASREEIEVTLKNFAEDPDHTILFEKQSPYITSNQMEIYKVLEFGA